MGLESVDSVLIVDQHDAFLVNLGQSFRSLGVEVCVAKDYAAAKLMAQKLVPQLIVSELKVGTEWAFEHVQKLKILSPGCRTVIATVYPSVATAVRAVKLGFDAYLPKPVWARQILMSLGPGEGGDNRDSESCAWPSLDRTIWEYLNEVYVEAGTMSEAARRLRLDRRSLRRMLAKHPPAR